MIKEDLTVAEMLAESYSCAVEKGWWDGVDNVDDVVAEKIALIHSELSEALEEFRRPALPGHTWHQTYYTDTGKPEGFGIELADVFIRIADLTEALGIDLEQCLREKMEYNRTRPHRHGDKRI